MLTATKDAIVREIDINAPVEKVWAAVTQAEHLGTWFGDSGATVDLRPGGMLTMRWKDHGEANARFEVVEPPVRLVFRWNVLEEDLPDDGSKTWVEFVLSPSENGTHLKVVESGFDALDTTDDKKAAALADHKGGWQSEIDELKAHVEGMS